MHWKIPLLEVESKQTFQVSWKAEDSMLTLEEKVNLRDLFRELVSQDYFA